MVVLHVNGAVPYTFGSDTTSGRSQTLVSLSLIISLSDTDVLDLVSEEGGTVTFGTADPGAFITLIKMTD